MANYFFQGVSLVEKLKFVDLAVALKSKLSQQNIIDLFNSIDVNKYIPNKYFY
jgi:hypothetical protein